MSDQGRHFIKVIFLWKKCYQSKWSQGIFANYCWKLEMNLPEAQLCIVQEIKMSQRNLTCHVCSIISNVWIAIEHSKFDMSFRVTNNVEFGRPALQMFRLTDILLVYLFVTNWITRPSFDGFLGEWEIDPTSNSIISVESMVVICDICLTLERCHQQRNR